MNQQQKLIIDILSKVQPKDFQLALRKWVDDTEDLIGLKLLAVYYEGVKRVQITFYQMAQAVKWDLIRAF